MSLSIKTFSEPPLNNNNYVVIDEASHEAVLIDCSAYDKDIMDYIQNQGASLKYILITHAHFDHILGVNEVIQKYQVPAYLDTDDFPLAKDMNGWLIQMGFQKSTVPQLTPLPPNLKIGQIPVRVIKTPGHTPGGVCYLIENNLFSGDTLFKGTYGRVDLPLSNPDSIRDSLSRLVQLPGEISVYPGHGWATTIADERGFYQ